MVGLRDDRHPRYPHDGSQKEVTFAEPDSKARAAPRMVPGARSVDRAHLESADTIGIGESTMATQALENNGNVRAALMALEMRLYAA